MTSLSCSVAWLDLQADPQAVVIDIGSWYQPCQGRRQEKEGTIEKGRGKEKI
jgi:hypothetical protein